MVKILTVALIAAAALATAQVVFSMAKGYAPRVAHFGGSRPFEVNVPDNYSAAKPSGLVIALHGFGSSGQNVENYFGLAAVTNEYGLFSVAPNGTMDNEGRRFWNATPACCNVDHKKVDDEGYLVRLVDLIAKRFSLDPKKIFIIGFSNGGFMAHRMACDQAGRIAAIVSVAGSTYPEESSCNPAKPVSMIQVHGTADQTIAYAGGNLRGAPFPGAQKTVSIWADLDGCDPKTFEVTKRFDFDSSTYGLETQKSIYPRCLLGTTVQLWKVQDGRHFLRPTKTFTRQVMEFFTSHSKLTA